MSENGHRTDETDGADGTHGTAESEDSPHERAKRLAVQLRFLRIRERTANFENREAIRREIRRGEEELAHLAAAGGFEVDVN